MTHISVMENKNTIPGLSDLLFVWNHIHERFRKLQEFNWKNNKSGPNSVDVNLTKEQTDEKDQEKGTSSSNILL